MRAPRVIAHRGSSALHADNSWMAFEAAVAEGADAIECDVQMTRDGVLVVRHDFTIGDHLVVDLSFADVLAQSGGVVVLGDLLAFAERAPIDLLVEIKDPDAAPAVAQTVAASTQAERTVVGSFHGPALAVIKAHAPEVKTSFMMGSVAEPRQLIALAAAFGADGIHLCWEARAPRPHGLLDRADIGVLHHAGLSITLWHEEREDELRALAALGPDGICTNTPGVLRRIVDDAHGAAAVAPGIDAAPHAAQERVGNMIAAKGREGG